MSWWESSLYGNQDINAAMNYSLSRNFSEEVGYRDLNVIRSYMHRR